MPIISYEVKGVMNKIMYEFGGFFQFCLTIEQLSDIIPHLAQLICTSVLNIKFVQIDCSPFLDYFNIGKVQDSVTITNS